ncbi:MAG TPA: hypothetical protein VFW00_07100 [Rhodocyclaceae bacterium]|nr:hypothetical protein [Rhodocyclaceae bacterium]
MPTFSAQINAWIAKTKDDADKIVRYALQTLDGRLVNRSPVGDGTYWQNPPPKGYTGGRFKGNWQVSIGSPASGIKNLIDKDGSATMAAHANVIAIAKAGEVQFLVNNLPYAERIEKGWSRQAPVGLVAVTVVEWNNIVEDAVNGVKAGGGDMAAGFGAYPL